MEREVLFEDGGCYVFQIEGASCLLYTLMLLITDRLS